MRDYYSEFIHKRSSRPAVGEVSKVPEDGESPSATTFDTFDIDRSQEPVNNSNSVARDQLEFEIAERESIMVYEGGMSEADALIHAKADVLYRWSLENHPCLAETDSKPTGKVTADSQENQQQK